MRIHVLKSRFARRPIRNTLIGVGVIAGIAIAAVGAVLGLMLLAAGALAHFSLRALRGIAAPATRSTGPAVIDGEFEVIRSRRMLGSR